MTGEVAHLGEHDHHGYDPMSERWTGVSLRAVKDDDSAGSPAESPQPPAYAELDPISRARLRRLAEQHLDWTPALEHHLDMVDARGAWYAEHVIEQWSTAKADAFWGLVNNYVRNHLPDRGPVLDVAAWVAAGAPERTDVAARWEEVSSCLPPALVVAAGTVSRAEVAYMDDLVAAWPNDLWLHFWHAYVVIEEILHVTGLTIPVLTD